MDKSKPAFAKIKMTMKGEHPNAVSDGFGIDDLEQLRTTVQQQNNRLPTLENRLRHHEVGLDACEKEDTVDIVGAIDQTSSHADVDLEKLVKNLMSTVTILKATVQQQQNHMLESENRLQEYKITLQKRLGESENRLHEQEKFLLASENEDNIGNILDSIQQAREFSMDCISDATANGIQKIVEQQKLGTQTMVNTNKVPRGSLIESHPHESILENDGGRLGSPETDNIDDIVISISEARELSMDAISSATVEELEKIKKWTMELRALVDKVSPRAHDADAKGPENEYDMTHTLEGMSSIFDLADAETGEKRNSYVYPRGTCTSKEFESMTATGRAPTYPEDCYSFLAIYSPKEDPIPFFYGLMVFFFQAMFFFLLIYYSARNQNNDNPADVSYPKDVTYLVMTTQAVAIASYIIFADDSLKECATAIEQFPSFNRSKGDGNVKFMVFSCALRFIQGLLASVAACMMIMTSDDVIEIILNFAAVNYISSLDDCAFELAKWGKWGPKLEKEANSIQKKQIPYCSYHKKHAFRHLVAILPVGILMVGLMARTMTKQRLSDDWTTQIIRVQFDNSPDLEQYSGCFVLDRDVDNSKRNNYNSDPRNEKKAVFGYCQENEHWILFKNIGDNHRFLDDPCEVGQEDILARSRRTEEFDISSNFDYVWFSNSGTPLPDMYFFDSKLLGNDLGPHCGSFLNDGICDDTFNKLAYSYDQGDCCASTCTHPKCGQDRASGAFGSDEAQGRSFHRCSNPKMANLTIGLNKISNSRDPNVMNVTDDQLILYAESGIDYWEETPVKPFFNIQCGSDSNSRTIFSTGIDKSMENETETIMIEDGAQCEFTLTNHVAKMNDWKSKPIWLVNYTVYHGNSSNSDNEIISTYSEEKESFYIKRIPDCYFDILDGMKISTAYKTNLDSNVALDWLLNDVSEYSKCDDDFLQERFALMAVYVAAPNSSAPHFSPGKCSHRNIYEQYQCLDQERKTLEHFTWISERSQCDWDNIGCDQGSVTTFDVQSEQLIGSISTWIGKLTGLVYMQYDHNKLSGTIPSELGLLTKLTSLDIDNNFITGTVPTEIGLLCNMQELDFDYNMISGTIPTEFGAMIDLREINLNGNRLSGSIPSEIFVLTNLLAIQVAENELSGTLQSEIGFLKNMTRLQMHENNLTRPIPSEIGRLTDLRKVTLYNNTFSGLLPTEFGLLTSLKILDLRNNSFTGQIPSEIGSLSNLVEIRLENNAFSGTIPPDLINSQHLQTLTSDDELLGSVLVPSHIKTLAECKPCGEDQIILYRDSSDGIDALSCVDLVEAMEDPNALISNDNCDAIKQNCVVCVYE